MANQQPNSAAAEAREAFRIGQAMDLLRGWRVRDGFGLRLDDARPGGGPFDVNRRPPNNA